MNKSKITTSHVNPPIPMPERDWCAYYEGYEEDSPYGWGATEEEMMSKINYTYKNWKIFGIKEDEYMEEIVHSFVKFVRNNV